MPNTRGVAGASVGDLFHLVGVHADQAADLVPCRCARTTASRASACLMRR
jgi:hypothetical protein